MPTLPEATLRAVPVQLVLGYCDSLRQWFNNTIEELSKESQNNILHIQYDDPGALGTVLKWLYTDYLDIITSSTGFSGALTVTKALGGYTRAYLCAYSLDLAGLRGVLGRCLQSAYECIAVELEKAFYSAAEDETKYIPAEDLGNVIDAIRLAYGADDRTLKHLAPEFIKNCNLHPLINPCFKNAIESIPEIEQGILEFRFGLTNSPEKLSYIFRSFWHAILPDDDSNVRGVYANRASVE
ncbi:hypothetical protein F5Y16DRAFT_395322 [Xylariaceae sp. FL0255]|nr:hypothetical protein F5Y16DRAFT_395322 [Xylariaceae sp. FL0255]